MNLPATRLSAMLYSCWKMMLPNMGRQNCHNTCDGLPTVRSLFIAKILLYNDYNWENSVNAATSIEPNCQKVKKIFGISAI